MTPRCSLMVVCLLLIACVSLMACGSSSNASQTSLNPLPRPVVVGLRAGASSIDVTPPPGLSLFGHGMESRVARGTLGRLMCQAIVVESPDENVALVTCDLMAISGELWREVARQLGEMRVPVAANRLFLMASHTHAGPAHYFPEHGYSGAMTSRLVGYDPEVLRWLADRIASAVRSASLQTVPAEIRAGQRELSGLTVNRSFGAYLHDVPPPDTHQHDGSRAAEATSKTLSVIRFDRVGGEPIAALSIFGIHNTGISNRNDLYHADIFGYARRALEREENPVALVSAQQAATSQRKLSQLTPIARAHVPSRTPVIFALANGAEGDVSPRVDERTAREARRIGEALAHGIHTLWHELADAPPSTELLVAARTLHLPNAAVDACGRERLCPSGELGVAAGGGAEDGPSGVRIIPVFNEGSRTTTPHGCQGRKLILVPPFQAPGSDPFFFPTYAPAATLRLGSIVLATLPFEVTTQAAARMIDRAKEELPLGTPVAVVGLTNAYLMYVTTEEEYDLQQYEGASTLYGPKSQRFWTTQVGCLAQWMSKPESRGRAWVDHCGFGQAPIDMDVELPIQPEPTRRLPRDPEVLGDLFNASLTPELTDNDGDRAYQLDFWGPAPGYARSRTRLGVEVHCVRGDAFVGCDGDGTSSHRADDTDGSVSVRALGQQDGSQHRWRVIWTPDPEALDGGLCQAHRFVVRVHETLVSDLFTPTPHDGCETWRARCALQAEATDATP